MDLGSWHTGKAYTQSFRHLSDRTISESSLLKFRAVVRIALFLGSFQRCWAWDPQDQCQGLIANPALPGWASWGSWTGYIDCIRQDSHCQDAPVPCNENECDAEFNLQEWLATLYGASVWPVSQSHERMMLVSGVCPLTCKVCGPHKDDRQVSPIVATTLRGPCELGWHYADSACYKYSSGRQDGGSIDRLDWFSAESACQAEGAHLATVMTPAQAHLVFELLRQCPAQLGRKCLWAWIGLWGQCSHNSSNWTWIGAPQLKISSSPLHSLFPAVPVCQPQSTGEVVGVYTHSRGQRGESFDFSSSKSSRLLRGWMCSKPALFHPVTDGHCQGVGLAPIHDLGVCEAAFKVLMGMDVPAIKIENTRRPFGCHVRGARIGPELNTEPGNHTVPAGPEGILLCQSPNATSQTASDTDLGLTGQWEGVRTSQMPPSFSQPLLVSLLAASFLPAFVVLVVRRRDFVALKQLVLLVASSLHTRVCKSKTGAPDQSIMVAARLQQKRRTIASIAAVAVACFHLFELVRICLVEESVCTSATTHPQLRLFLALVHLGSLWLASAFLAITQSMGQNSSRPDLAFLLAITVLDVIQTALIGEQALLVESRLYSQFLWRLLLGACASPVVVLMGSILHLIGVGAVYKAFIPDGFIFTVGSTRAGLLYHQGCNQLWSQADALTGKDLLLDMSRLSGITDVSARLNLQALLDELLKKRTSFNNFVQSEVLLLTIVMACLVFLSALISKEISKSLRLQVSEDQLLAVSQVMDSLCDATCQLSRDLRICCGARKLGAILHMSPSGPSALEGTDFCGIIAREDDCAGFRAFVEQGIRNGFKGAHYLDLKGASSMRLRMQVLCAHFMDALGHPRVLCGFTELQAGGAEAGITDTVGPLAPGRAPQQKRHKHRTSNNSGSSSGGSSSGSISSLGSGSHRRSKTERAMKVEVQLDDTLRVVKTNTAFMKFLGADAQRSATLKPFLVEPEVSAQVLRCCVNDMGPDEFGASSARVINIVFNTGLTSQDRGAAAGSTTREAVCRATRHQSPASSSGATLRLEVLEVLGLGDSAPPGLGPRSLGRSLAERCSI